MDRSAPQAGGSETTGGAEQTVEGDRLAALVAERSHQRVAFTTRDGVITAVSSALQRDLGTAAPQGQPLSCLVAAEDVERVEAARGEAVARERGLGAARVTWPALGGGVTLEVENRLAVPGVGALVWTWHVPGSVRADTNAEGEVEFLAERLDQIAEEVDLYRLRRRGAEQGQSLPVERLSTREREILRQVLTGRRATAVARDLYLAPSTVRNHLSSAYRKLGVSGYDELVDRIGEERDRL